VCVSVCVCVRYTLTVSSDVVCLLFMFLCVVLLGC
jgi:hypothetical protein